MSTRGAGKERPLIDAVQKRCRVWWPGDQRWYGGTVAHWTSTAPESVLESEGAKEAHDRKGWYLVVYDDGEHAWLQLPTPHVVIGSRTALPATPRCPPRADVTPAVSAAHSRARSSAEDPDGRAAGAPNGAALNRASSPPPPRQRAHPPAPPSAPPAAVASAASASPGAHGAPAAAPPAPTPARKGKSRSGKRKPSPSRPERGSEARDNACRLTAATSAPSADSPPGVGAPPHRRAAGAPSERAAADAPPAAVPTPADEPSAARAGAPAAAAAPRVAPGESETADAAPGEASAPPPPPAAAAPPRAAAAAAEPAPSAEPAAAAVPELPAAALAQHFGFAIGGQRRSGRVRHVGDPADTTQLWAALKHFERVWRGPHIGAEVLTDVGGVRGLHVCHGLLAPDEVRALRLLFDAHKCWAQYIYGTSQVVPERADLNSVLQRIDFGPVGCMPEGVVASQSPMWPIGAARTRLLALLQARVRSVFGQRLPWDDAEHAADMMQFTQMRPNEELAPHYDSRDRWGEGIASMAWGQGEGLERPEGEPWTLMMRRGSARAPHDCVDVPLPPGTGYILTREAQGRTEHCAAGKVAHQRCSCCWLHGVQTKRDGFVARQSVTIRVYAKWHGAKAGLGAARARPPAEPAR